MKITVCIPTVRVKTLEAAVESIRSQTWTNWELIIVGQGQDEALNALGQAIARQDDRIRYLRIEEKGLSRARNAGIKVATANVIAFIDDDCEAHPHWLATIVECFAAQPDVGLVAGSLVAPHPARTGIGTCPHVDAVDAIYDPVANPHRPPSGWDWFGANCAIRRNVIERVGFFDEYLGAGSPFGGAEDYDYKLRLEKSGIRMRTTSRLIVYHTGGWRYGLRAFMQLRRNYWRGNGALAAKLTLLGSTQGRTWLNHEIKECLTNCLSARRAWQQRRLAMPNPVRLWYFVQGYRDCMQHFRVDRTFSALQPLSSKKVQLPDNTARC